MENIHTNRQAGHLDTHVGCRLDAQNQFGCATEPACIFVCMFSSGQPCYSACGSGTMSVAGPSERSDSIEMRACKTDGTGCYSDATCCSGHCWWDNGVGRCGPCMTDGTGCIYDADCCSGLCGWDNGLGRYACGGDD